MAIERPFVIVRNFQLGFIESSKSVLRVGVCFQKILRACVLFCDVCFNVWPHVAGDNATPCRHQARSCYRLVQGVGISWIIAWPTIMIVSPLVNRIVTLLVRTSKED